MSKETSTVEYLSNLQPVDISQSIDVQFLRHIHDPFALEILDRLISQGAFSYKMTGIQQVEMQNASRHCAYAYKDDYPWGTILVENSMKVVCKCLNSECIHFNQCRKNYPIINDFEFKSMQGELSVLIAEEVIEKSAFQAGMEFKDVLSKTVIALPINDKKIFDETESEEISTGKSEIIDIIPTEFHNWMLESDKLSSHTVTNYSNALKLANDFANENNIWSGNIVEFDLNKVIKCIVDFLDSKAFQNHRHSKANLYHALQKYKEFRVDTNTMHQELPALKADEQNNSSVSDSKIQRVEEVEGINFDSNGFNRFVETEQDAVIFSEPSERIVINAGPGTGKTWALIEKLMYMVNEQGVDPEEILVLCFSRAAVEVIENRLKSVYEDNRIGMNWHSIDIRTFDSFATHLLAWVLENNKEMISTNLTLDSLDYQGRISAATEVLLKDSTLLSQCTHLVVDEIQDLVSVRAKFVMQIIKSMPNESGYTLLGDSCQSIYDYQISSGDIGSSEFYTWIFESQQSSLYLKFTVNHRQVSKLEKLGNKYREAILNGENDILRDVSNEIYANIEELEKLELHDMSSDFLDKISLGGNLGILTRTNGQALKISTWLRNAGVPHKIQKPLSDNTLNRWIADLFLNYENETIDKTTFLDLLLKLDYMKKDQVSRIWQILEKTQNNSQNRYYVKDLLNGIANNAKAKEFYTFRDNEYITVSNIHRSKGREYDSILLLNDTLLVDEESKKTIQEHKVSYVAVTRAKKKMYRSDMGKHYIVTDKNGDGRAYQKSAAFRGKKPGLTHIELGKSYDIDPLSFVDNESTQYLLCNLERLIGERVVLIKNKEKTKSLGYVCYDVTLEENKSIGALGRTSKKFYDDLTRIIKSIMGFYNIDLYEYVYPDRFSEIYIDDIVSVVHRFNPIAVAGKRHADMMVWKGITLIGFAQVERDKY